jgi:hypothetical protein
MASLQIAALTVTAILLAAPALAATPARLDTSEVRQWRQDLEFVRREMPAQHANLFHTMTPARFDSALAAIESGLPRLSRAQVIVELMRLDALVADGHSNVSAWRDTAIRFHELPVSLYEFEDGLFVRAATAAHADLVGGRVLKIGDSDVDDALARMRPLIGHDNEMGIRAWAPVLLVMPEVLYAVGLLADPARVPIQVELGGRRRDVMLEPAGPFPMRTGETDRSWMTRAGWVDARGRKTPRWLSDPANTYWYEAIPAGRSLYCQVNAIQQAPGDSLAAFMARALAAADSTGAERFVLDLRLNGGGDGYLVRDILLPLIKSHYDAPGRLYVITGRRTWSAAQMLICELEKYTHARFVGEPSSSRGNLYGDSKRIVLPNSRVTVRVSSLYWQYWDPRDDRPWIPVDIAAPLTFQAYEAAADPALEAALAGGRRAP